MTTTALHPTPCLAHHSSRTSQPVAARAWQTLATLVVGVLEQTRNRHDGWRQTEALSEMDAHMLRDIGAPHWLHERAHLRRALECREHFEALSRFKY